MFETSSPFVTGLGLTAGLIMALGPQNAFVLKHGLARRHVIPVVMVTIACDMFLITLGTFGWGSVVNASPTAMRFATLAGGIFLCLYGLRSFASALSPNAARGCGLGETTSLSQVVTITLGFSLLNPHAYLDTVVLIGSVGAQYHDLDRVSFAAGAFTASVLWFLLIGFGASAVAPLFESERAWRLLDIGMGTIVCAIGISLF